MGEESTFSDVVSAANENISRLTRNVALTASTVISGGANAEHHVSAPSAYHQAFTSVIQHRSRRIAPSSAVNSNFRESLAHKILGVRAPQLPNELLTDLPPNRRHYSLFQNFCATVSNPVENESVSNKLIVRKETAASELLEIDEKIGELQRMRKLVFERMADAEREQPPIEPTLQHYYPTGEQITHINGSEPILHIDFNSPFGQLALTRGQNVELYELSCESKEQIVCESVGDNTANNQVRCLTVHGSEPVVFAGVGCCLNSWRPQLSTTQLSTTPSVLYGHVGDVLCIDYDGDSLVSAAMDCTVRLWDEKVSKNTVTLDMYAFSACHTLQHAASALATGHADGVVRLFDLRSASNRPQRELRGGHGGHISALHFSNLEMVSGSSDGSVRLWDLRNGQVIHTESFPHSVTALSFDATKIVASVSGERGVHVYSRATSEHRMSAMDATAITTAKYMKGYLVAGRESGDVGVWAV